MSDRPRCTATSKRSGLPCGNWPLTGATVCRIHGAGRNTPARKKAERKVQEAAAKATAARRGLPREVDPHTAMLQELWRSAGYVDYLDEMVRGAPDHAWWEALLHERRHLTSVARDCIRAGIEERRVKLAEQQATLIAAFGRGLLTAMGIDPNSEPARVAFRTQLQLIAGEAS